jgi:hypothetical protein
MSPARLEFPVARTLDAAAPFVDPALIEPAAWARARAIGAWFPAAAAEAIVLECRLRASAPEVDLSVRLSPVGGAIVAGLNPVMRLPDETASDAAWTRVRALCARWIAAGSSTRRAVDHLWLEFDAPPAGSHAA